MMIPLVLRDLRCTGAKEPSVAQDPENRDHGVVWSERRLCSALFFDGTSFDRTGEAATSIAVAGVLLDPVGTASDGAAGIRPSVSLVYRYWR